MIISNPATSLSLPAERRRVIATTRGGTVKRILCAVTAFLAAACVVAPATAQGLAPGDYGVRFSYSGAQSGSFRAIYQQTPSGLFPREGNVHASAGSEDGVLYIDALSRTPVPDRAMRLLQEFELSLYPGVGTGTFRVGRCATGRGGSPCAEAIYKRDGRIYEAASGTVRVVGASEDRVWGTFSLVLADEAGRRGRIRVNDGVFNVVREAPPLDCSNAASLARASTPGLEIGGVLVLDLDRQRCALGQPVAERSVYVAALRVAETTHVSISAASTTGSESPIALVRAGAHLAVPQAGSERFHLSPGDYLVITGWDRVRLEAERTRSGIVQPLERIHGHFGFWSPSDEHEWRFMGVPGRMGFLGGGNVRPEVGRFSRNGEWQAIRVDHYYQGFGFQVDGGGELVLRLRPRGDTASYGLVLDPSAAWADGELLLVPGLAVEHSWSSRHDFADHMFRLAGGAGTAVTVLIEAQTLPIVRPGHSHRDQSWHDIEHHVEALGTGRWSVHFHIPDSGPWFLQLGRPGPRSPALAQDRVAYRITATYVKGEAQQRAEEELRALQAAVDAGDVERAVAIFRSNLHAATTEDLESVLIQLRRLAVALMDEAEHESVEVRKNIAVRSIQIVEELLNRRRQ